MSKLANKFMVRIAVIVLFLAVMTVVHPVVAFALIVLTGFIIVMRMRKHVTRKPARR